LWYSTKTIGANKKGIKTSCDTLSVITNPDSVRMKWFSSSSYWGYTWGTSNIYDYAKAIYYYLHDSAANVAGAFFHLLVKDVGYGDTIKFYVGQGSMGEPSTLWQSLLVKPIQFIMSLTKDSVIIPVSDIGTNLDTILYIDFPNDPLVYDSLFLMFNHAIIKGLLFLSGSYLVYNSKTKYLSELNGIGKIMPLTSFLFALGAFAIVGFPPFAGFWSKLAVLTAAADSGMLLIVGLILSISVIEVVYYLRVVNRIYFVKREVDVEIQKPTPQAVFSMLVLGAVIIAIGFYPDLVTGILHKASAALLDKTTYINDVLSQTIN
jgi:hypothetical protein